MHFQSRENFSELIRSVKERLSIEKISERVNSFVERLNDRLFGVQGRRKQADQVEGESKYWKDITGMNKRQFLYAAKKEANDFIMFSGL